MSSKGTVTHDNITVAWDEEKNDLDVTLEGPGSCTVTLTYNEGRHLLDCLMTIFGRQELTYRYPEVK